MNLRSSEETAWVQFLLGSDNSIMRDAGEVLLTLTGDLFDEEKEMVPLEQKIQTEWESALLLAECFQRSEVNNLVEVSRIIYEWFHTATEESLQPYFLGGWV
jgi:hypothetical protein